MTSRSQSLPSLREKTALQPTRRSLALYIGFICLLLGSLSAFAYEAPPAAVHLATYLVVVTSLVPLLRWHYRALSTLPMFELICTSYGVQFGAAALLQPKTVRIIYGEITLPWEALVTALLYVELGLVALIGSYYLTARIPAFGRLPEINIPLSRQRMRPYILIALLIGLMLESASLFGLKVGPFSAFLFLARLQMNLALAVWAFDHYSRRGSGPEELLLLGATGVVAGMGLLSGMLENALIPMVLILAARWTASRRIPKTWIVGGILLFLILNQAKFVYRGLTWDPTQSYTISERLILWRDISQQSVRDYGDNDFNTSASELARQNISRFDLIHRFTWVVTQTPRHIPHFQGESYRYLLVGWIPRALWPDKPIATDAVNKVDLDYSFKLPFQVETTMIGIGQLPEAFVNFGMPGVPIVMALQGFLLSLLNILFNRPNSEGGRAVYLNQMVFFLNGIGTATVIMFGALVQQLLANAIILHLAVGQPAKRPGMKAVHPLPSRLPRYPRSPSSPR